MLRITRIALAFMLLVAGTSVVPAQRILLLGAGSKVKAGGAPPVCSNSLDFSQACNSQYIPAIVL